MGLNPIRFAVLPLGDRLVAAAVQRGRVEAFVVEAEQPAEALRAELDARKLRPRTVAIGLPRTAVTVKPIELPLVGGELYDMVKFELERHVPFPADDASFDFISLPQDTEAAGARRVLLVAADRRTVDSALRLFDDTGLRPRSVTVAAHDLVGLVAPVRKQRVVWVHRAGSSVDLLFLTGSTIVLSRSVTAADDALVAGEIKRSFSISRWRGCDAIWVSGDPEPEAILGSSPLADLGVPVTEPPYTSRARGYLAAIDREPRGALQLAIAVAAARGGRPLDLIPAALRPRRLTRGQLFTAGTAVAAIVLGFAALVVPGYRDKARLSAVNAQIAQLDAQVKAVERVQTELTRKTKLLATIDQLEPAAMKPLPVIRELTELLPTDAWLTLLSLDGKGVELTGQAAAASTLIPLLENSPRLERVEFASPVTRGRDKEQFRILARWEGSGASALVLPQAPAVAGPGAGPGAPAAPPGGARPSRAAAAPPTTRPPLEEDVDAVGPAQPRRPASRGAVPGEPGRAVPAPEPRQ